jgi:ribosome biogenesis GTPase A
MARMRTAFELPVKTAVQWYPGHMAKGLQVMRTRIRSCNCVLEVHDARIPYSGRNRAFFELIANKPHLLILNKKDLAETQGREQVIQQLGKLEMSHHVLYANCVRDYDDSHKQVSCPSSSCIKCAE